MSLYEDNEINKIRNRKRLLLVLNFILFIIIFLWHSQMTSILGVLKIKFKDIYSYLYILVSEGSIRLAFQKLNITKILNNRELALSIWLMIFIIYLIVNKNTRSSVWSLIKVIFDKKLTMLYICMMIYTSFIVYILYRIDFWKVSLLKDTIIWFLFTGVITAFQAIDKAENITYFKKVFLDNFKFILIFQFIVNFYTFSLIGELILIPVSTIIIVCICILNVLPEFQNEKSKPVKKLFKCINTLLGLYIIINSIVLAFKDIKNLETIDTFKSILLPIILSTTFILFIFLFALWAGYEQIFIRIQFGEKKSRRLIIYIKIKVFLLCHFNFNRVKSFWRTSGFRVLNATNKSDVLKAIIEYKEQEKLISNNITLKS
ncbi:hypothetical protein [Clostridium uliginosum]|uniref:Uncharacterized protein n=1 Tax=Clostridium uliginosum TaxID=119641 RepID=A0A1I1LRF2_9CLOT|nr:hypothetical protein [Clostridium uliginosum]SFC75817.1 hypothetical protein SAMN05421842_1096 [Clostridium uliginosum]